MSGNAVNCNKAHQGGPVALAWRALLLIGALLFGDTAQALVLTQAQVRAEASSTWETATLPDHWGQSRPRHGGAMVYRLTVNLPDAQGPLGVFLRRACGNSWVSVNGHTIYSGGGPDEGPRVRRLCYYPVVALWPQGEQRPGQNVIEVRVYQEPSTHLVSEQRMGYLSEVEVGPWEAMQAKAEREWRIRILLSQITTALMVFAGLMLLMLWWRRRHETGHLALALTFSLGAILTARVYVTALPLDNLTTERVLLALTYLLGAAFSGYVHSFRSPITARYVGLHALLFIAAVVPIALVAPAHLRLTSQITYSVMMLLILANVWGVVNAFWRRSVPVHAAATDLLAMSLALVVVTVHDYLVQLGWLTYTDRPLIQVVLPLLLLAFFARLLRQHTKALQEAEKAKSDLEWRVREVTEEIERSHQRAVRLEAQQAAQAERERIARDLHDDLGARLLTLVHRSPHGQASETAREALSDLRMLIGQLNAPARTLSDALADWRAEASQRCEAAGRSLLWENHCPVDTPLSVRAQLALARFVREAITNVLKHTKSPTVRVSLATDDTALVLSVADEDAGTPPVAQWSAGYGMSNQRHRASQVQAEVTWHDRLDEAGRKTGSVVTYRLPLAGASGPALTG